MMFCTACGKPIPAEARYCPRCGAGVETQQNVQLSVSGPLEPPPIQQTDAKRDIGHRSFTAWIVVLTFVSGIVQWAMNRGANSAFVLGSALGASIGCLALALVIAGIRRLFTKHGFNLTVLQSWGIILVLSTLGNLVSWSGTQRVTHIDHPEQLHAAVNHLESAVASSSVASNDVSSATETDSEGLARALNQAANLYKKFNQKTTTLSKEEQALPLDEILSPASLTTSTGIANGRRIMQKYEQILDGYQTDVSTYFEQSRSIMETTPIGIRADVLSGFDKSNAKARAAFANYLVIERSFLVTVNQILDLGQRNLGTSQATGNQILLPPDQLAVYQQLISRLQMQAAQEAQALKTMNDLRQESIGKMKAFDSALSAESTNK